MEYLEIVRSFLVGILSNATYDKMKVSSPIDGVESVEKVDSEHERADIEATKSFPIRSLYAYYGEHSNDWFLPLANLVQEPNVFIFLEAEASTHYNLGAVILEDNRTGDWYPFYKSVALQGSGGGWRNTERLYNSILKLQDNGKPVALSLRVARNSDTAKLEKGEIYWDEYKQRTIPALICQDEFLSKLQSRFFEDLVQLK
ncbi:hypothetical protein [Vibrio sp. Vb339]|uniref:hypothetical protein n=1 Tax=Vibrio sp. Vb339 TaxID=1192013 RepID=UPI001554BE03|nr:hypothetical protein [Vibrio sp. Vb339]